MAENLLAFDQQFWFRLATRSDGAQSNAERETLTNLANVRSLTAHRAPFVRMHACSADAPSVVP